MLSSRTTGFLNEYHNKKARFIYRDDNRIVYDCDCPICKIKNVFMLDASKNILGKKCCSHYWQFNSWRNNVDFLNHIVINQ